MLTVKELQEWEHYDEFIKLRREEHKNETTEEFLNEVKYGRYKGLADIVMCTAAFCTMPKWKEIWMELPNG